MANAAQRITEVLTLLENSAAGMSAVEVARSLSVSRAASSRLLSLMVDASLVERDATTQKYVLGLDLWVTSSVALQRLPIMDLSLLPMTDGVRRSGIQLVIAVNRGLNTFFLRRVERVQDYVVATPIARKTPVHLSATGKAILAFDTAAVQAAVLDDDLPSRTDKSLGQDELNADLEEIRSRGYARNFGEGRPTDRGLAVPIFDSSMSPIAGLGTSLPRDAHEDQAVAVLNEVAHLISRSLGYVREVAVSLP